VIVLEGYLGIQISRENFVGIQQAIGGLVGWLPEEGITKGAAIMVCQDEETRDWIAARVTTLVAGEGSRHKMVSWDALLTCKRVVASF
jgi:hypothetical protein